MNNNNNKIYYCCCIFGTSEKGQLGAKCQLCQNNHSATDLTLLIVRDSMITVRFTSPGIHEPWLIRFSLPRTNKRFS